MYLENGNIIVVGLGSMGKRRIRLMRAQYENCTFYGVDQSDERREASLMLGVSKSFSSLSEALLQVESTIAFICTAPISHKEIILDCLNNKINVFTELNLVSDGYEEMIALAEKNELTLFLSSTLLYRKDLQYIIEKTKNETVNYIYHTGQYLPDWHPWENINNFFVSNKRTNGCREIFAIDLPWLLKAMGNVVKIHVQSSKMSSLDIDYNDNYIVTLEHSTGSKGVICVDIISRKATRKLEIYSEDIHIDWDGTPDHLYSYNIETSANEKIETYDIIDKNEKYCSNIIENAYLEEITTFFDVVRGKQIPFYTFKDDFEVLDLIDRIEGEI